MDDHDVPTFASIADTSAAIRDGRLSPIALADHCLGRIEALNPTLNAFITVTADLAREAARRAESEIRAGRWRGNLHGLPHWIVTKFVRKSTGVRGEHTS